MTKTGTVKPGKHSTHQSPLSRLGKLGLYTLIGYGLLLIPTLMMVYACVETPLSVSRLIEETWRFSYLGLSEGNRKLLSISIDVTTFILIGLSAVWYAKGIGILNRAEPASGNRRDPLMDYVLAGTFLLGLALLAVIPFHSHDLYGYINRGAQLAVYGMNPYTHTVEDLKVWHDDPMFHDHWIHNPCPYGFFFTLIAQGLCWLSGRHFFIAFLLFKGMNVLLHTGNTFLVYLLSKRLGNEKPWLNAYLYGWNPLMLLHLVANGHNDVLTAFLLLVSLLLISVRSWAWLSIPVLTLSVLTKYATLLAFPFMAIYLLRGQQWRSLVWGTVTGLCCILLLAVPFWVDPLVIPWAKMQENATMSQHSLHSMVSRIVYYLAQWIPALEPWITPVKIWIKWLLYGGFALGTIGFLVRFYKTPSGITFPGLLRAVTLPTAILLVFISAKFHAWYLGMIFPLMLLLPTDSRFRQFAILLSFSQLLAFTPLENLHIGNYLLLSLLPFFWVYRKKENHPGNMRSGVA